MAGNAARRGRRRGQQQDLAPGVAQEGAGETIDQERMVAALDLVRSRTPLHVDGFPLIVLYSPKSGCTSAAKWFFWQTGLLEEARAYGNWIHRYENQVLKREPNYRRDLIAELYRGEKRLIKFTRDPFQRAVSSFLMLSGRQMARPGFFGHAEWRKIRTHKYGDPEDRRGASFADFLRYLRDAAATGAKVNGHLAQQFREAEAAFKVEYYRLESMTATIRQLEAQLGLAAAPEELFSSRHHRSYDSAVLSGAATMEITEATFADADPPHYRAFYSPETEELAVKVFADDFARYGYPTRLAG